MAHLIVIESSAEAAGALLCITSLPLPVFSLGLVFLSKPSFPSHKEIEPMAARLIARSL